MKKVFIAIGAPALLLCAGSASAVEFNRGELIGSWDTTLSYGLQSRVSKPDDDLIGLANGGNAYSVNGDDGTLNYNRGVFSNTAKFTTELQLDYLDYGGFFRATGFYDTENQDNQRKKIQLTEEAKDLVGSDVDMLDAYVWGNFTPGGKDLQLRAGNQLLSWGESTFIQNGINTINPVDVNKARVPGAELREALMPVPIVSASLVTSRNASVEAFYQVQWKETEIDPSGSYFSTADFAGAGGERVMLGFGAAPDNIGDNVVIQAPATTGVVSRSADREADDEGQFGLAYRLFAPKLNDTEFGLYFVNYHSRLPFVGAHTGTAAAAGGADPDGQSYVQTANYYFSYPEDIKLYGFSFNTSLGQTGIALQGEISYRQDMPLQIDDVEILFAALGAQDNLSPGMTSAAPLASEGQLGLVPFDTDIPGYIRRDVTQAQMTASYTFGPGMGADSTLLMAEAGVTHIVDMPDKDVLRLEGPGTYISGNPDLAAFHHNTYEGAAHFADQTSWGLRVLTRMSFNNAIGGINLLPRLVYNHDVNGVSPSPGGNFVEGRKAITLGVAGEYQNKYSADLSYTNFYGAGRHNLINDRDYVAFNVKYSF